MSVSPCSFNNATCQCARTFIDNVDSSWWNKKK